MAEGLLKICRGQSSKKPAQVLAKATTDQVLEFLTAQVLNGADEAPSILKLIFDGTAEDKNYARVKDIVKKVFQLLNSDDVTSKTRAELISCLSVEIDVVPTRELVQLMDFMVDAIKAGRITCSKSLELFPRVLSILASLPAVKFATGETGELSGSLYKSHILNTVCSIRWNSSIVLLLATMFRDIPMSDEELKFVIEKVVRMLDDLDIGEVAPLVYQLLLLCTKGHKARVLDGIIAFFNSKTISRATNSLLQDDESDVAALRAAQGNVILHVVFAVRQDLDLGRELLKYLKANVQRFPQKILSPFCLALSLALCHIRRLEGQILDFLKAVIIKNMKERERQKASKWVNDLFPEACDMESAILCAVKNSKYGGDYVTQGLIELGFALLTAYTPKQSESFSLKDDLRHPLQKACKLGASIIQEVFQDQDIVRESVLEKLLNIILTGSSQSNVHYVDLLASVVACAPQVVLDYQPKFREVFDYIGVLSLKAAEGLLRAILPLMKVSLNLKDALLLVLRKAMFSKQVSARKIAVTGFLLILKHFQVHSEGRSLNLCSQVAYSQTFSCSQVQVSTQGRYNTSANESLCLEIIRSLHRSLAQHGNVRLHLYEGIYEVVCKNPQLTQPVLEMLFSQFCKYYDGEPSTIPPVKLAECLSVSGEQVFLSEPLAHLLCALQLCTKKSAARLNDSDEEDESLSHLLDDVEDVMSSLTSRMLKADIEDFELDKSSDFSINSSVGVKNTIFGKLILGLYEALMEYNFMTGNFSVESCDLTKQLFEKRQKLCEVLADNNPGAGKKGRTAASQKGLERNLFSLKCLTTIITSVLSCPDVATKGGLTVLRPSIDMIKFLLSCIHQKLTQLLDCKQCDGAGGTNPDHIFRQCCLLSSSFLQQIIGDSKLPAEVLSKDKGRKVTSLCLEGLSLIFSYVSNYLPHKVESLMTSIDFSRDVLSQGSKGAMAVRVIQRLQRMIIKIITSPSDELGPKEANIVLSAMSRLFNQLNPSEQEFQNIYEWFYRVAVEQNVDDVAFSKAVLGHLLQLHRQSSKQLSLIRKLAQDVHCQLGDIDEEVEIENRTNFKIVTEKTAAPTTFVALLLYMEKSLEEVDWSLVRLKGAQAQASKDVEVADDLLLPNEKIETAVCESLIDIVLSLHELVQAAFPLGVCSDAVTKVLTKLYTTLGLFTKYYLQLYSQKLGRVLPKYEKLVKMSGSRLSQQVYAMITFMQATQMQAAQDQYALGKTKGKKSNITGKNRALKESRCIPNLIYSIEQYERYLITLSKKCKIDLMKYIKRSTSRDFRINAASLDAALQCEDEDQDCQADADASVDADESAAQPAAQRSQVMDLTREDEQPHTTARLAKRVKLSSGYTRRALSSLGNST